MTEQSGSASTGLTDIRVILCYNLCRGISYSEIIYGFPSYFRGKLGQYRQKPPKLSFPPLFTVHNNASHSTQCNLRS
jgi:hypothetical protein